MIRDRGNIKWTAMRLTEHVKEIRVWYQSDNDIPNLDYDEFSLNASADDYLLVNKRSKVYEGEILELLPNAIKLISKDSISKLKLRYIIKVDIFN